MASKERYRPVLTAGELNLCGRVISYRVRRSARARWLRLEIKPGTGLTVVVPRGSSADAAPGFIRAKQGWVLRTLDKYERAKPLPVRAEIEVGDAVPYLGGTLTVVSEEVKGETECVTLSGDSLVVCPACSDGELAAVLEQWYRARAAEMIAVKVEKWSPRLGVTCRGITIRGQKTRWGSCSVNGRLNFNWKLLMVPEAVIDYVVIHELAHLKQMNHSPRFWQVVAKHCAHWRELRQWLKDHEVDMAAGLFAC